MFSVFCCVKVSSDLKYSPKSARWKHMISVGFAWRQSWTRRGTKNLKLKKIRKCSYFKRFPHFLRGKCSINELFGVFEVLIKLFLPHWMRSLLLILHFRKVPYHMSLVDGPAHLNPWKKMMETLNFCIVVLLGVLVQDKE